VAFVLSGGTGREFAHWFSTQPILSLAKKHGKSYDLCGNAQNTLWADLLVNSRSIQMAGWFEMSKSKDGQFRFVLKAGNAETVLTSELYKSKRSAENGIASVQKNCANEVRYERKTASNGKAFFNLKAGNHQVIGSSQMYASEASRENGIASVKTNGVSKTVKDNT
jgi:uncharacterized protein